MAEASRKLAQSAWATRRLTDTLSNDALLPGEVLRVRKEARTFADDFLRPLAHNLNTAPEHRDAFRRDVFEAIAAAGLYRVPFPADVGGQGLEFPTLAAVTVLEELGYYAPGAASAMYDAQALLVGTVLDSAGGALRSTYLPKLIRGEFVACFATSEPEASTDLAARSVQTTASLVEGGWRIDGRKRWITNSVAADYIVLLCRTEAALSILFVDMHQPGVRVFDPDQKMGNHAQLTADVQFEGAFAPADRLVGQVGGGLRAALRALTLGRIGIGALGVAMAQRALDVASAYTSERLVYGRPIASNQYWQYRFAEHAIEIESARSLYQKAAHLTDVAGDAGLFAAMAKVKGSSTAVDVARDAVQACGGYGFVRDMPGSGQSWPLEAIYRDAKVGEIYEGANEVQKWIIARTIFGRELTG